MTKDLVKKESLEILSDLQKDPLVAEEKFNKLSRADQASLFISATFSDRLKLVDIAYEPREVLEKVPTSEIWFTLKEIGPGDALSLIKYSTPEQLQAICDIEWWKKDHLDNDSIYEWLNYISACGLQKMVEWYKEGDWEQVLFFFRGTIIVVKKEDKEEDPIQFPCWPREDAPITYEGLYYYQVLDKDRSGLIEQFLEVLAKTDIDLYNKICESCLWDSSSYLEEEAYERRERRLAEHGFPGFEEALSIYSPLSKSKFKMAEKRPEVIKEDLLAPSYPLTVLGDKVLFINRVLAVAGEDISNRFLSEVAGLANKIIIADGKEITEEAMKDALIKAIGYSNIGLEVVSEGDVQKAEKIIKEYWLLSVFQAGLSEIVKLAGDVKKTINNSWVSGDKDNLSLLEPSSRAFIVGLLNKRPKYFFGGDPLLSEGFRDFSSVSELATARDKLKRVEFTGRIILKLFADSCKSIFDLVDDAEELRFTGVLLTCLIQSVYGGSYLFKPVSVEELQRFLSEIKEDEKLEKLFDDFDSWILSETPLAKEEKVYLDKLLNASKKRFQDEFRDLSDTIDPRYIHSVWVV